MFYIVDLLNDPARKISLRETDGNGQTAPIGGCGWHIGNGNLIFNYGSPYESVIRQWVRELPDSLNTNINASKAHILYDEAVARLRELTNAAACADEMERRHSL